MFTRFIFFSFLFLNSCCGERNNPDKPPEERSMNYATGEEIYKLKKKVREGDIEAYDRLSVIYLDYPAIDFLPWAIIMADHGSYSQANLDVYYTLEANYDGKNKSFEDMPMKSQKLALEYLNYAIQEGDTMAQAIAKELAKKGVDTSPNN